MSILNLFNLGSFAGADTGESYPLPADSVLLWDRDSESTAVPNGFSIYTSADNRLIQGTTTLADAGVTGGTSATMSISAASTGFSGAHTGTSFTTVAAFPPNSLNPVSPTSGPAGSHAHPTSATPVSVPSSVKPMGRFMVLITNSSEVSEVPLNCVIFSSTRPAFFTRKTFDTQSVGIYTGTTTFSRFKNAETSSFVVSTGPNGAHIHRLPNPVGTTGTPTPVFPNTVYTHNPSPVGAHTHPNASRTLIIYQQFKHLLPFMASANRPVKSGMIVMYKGASVPSGWKLCDGTNGTPNMNGFFLGYDNNENAHDIVKSNKRINSSPVTPYGGYPLPTTSPPSPTNYDVQASFNTPDFTWPHSHLGTAVTAAIATSPGQFHATFNVPHSHTWPSTNVVFPSNFVPDFIKLVFIQKE